MALFDRFEVPATASYIKDHGYTRVALQFPDELLRHSVEITRELDSICDSSVRFFVMADTTFGSCCVDEVAAAHVNADCVVHYGRACLSPVSRLPVWFVFGRSPMDIENCAQAIADLATSSDQHLLVLYDLEYAYAMHDVQDAVQQNRSLERLTFAEMVDRAMSPSNETEPCTTSKGIAGLRWGLSNVEECRILWIGREGPALTSVLLTYSSSVTVRYDPESGSLLDMESQSRALWRRYYLIERAKEANIVGIVVGTLGVAGYNQAIRRVKQMVKDAGKKSYTLAVGKPNPAKLANFPECEVFVLVACPQTALLDNKDYFAPVITTFEAELAFVRGRQWTGSYCLDFRKLPAQSPVAQSPSEEPHFSFIKGSYVSSTEASTEAEEANGELVLRSGASSALSLIDKARQPTRASEFFQLRSFQGLQLDEGTGVTEPDYNAVTGRSGRAASYVHESST